MIRARGVVELDSHILFVLVYHSDMNYHVVDCNPSSSALTLDMWIKKILNDGHQKRDMGKHLRKKICSYRKTVLTLSNIEIYNLCFLPFEVE
jgi:hypothetical protein